MKGAATFGVLPNVRREREWFAAGSFRRSGLKPRDIKEREQGAMPWEVSLPKGVDSALRAERFGSYAVEPAALIQVHQLVRQFAS